jgi:hypothetical protein
MSKILVLLLSATLAGLVTCSPVTGQNDEPVSLPISAAWSGDYPVAAIGDLPAGQQQNRVGYFGDAAGFARAWQSFRPREALPAVDFSSSLVVFSRNVDFYNRTNILKVTLRRGEIEILAMETMSARPIEEQAAMAMAVIPRDGIRVLRLDAATTLPIDGHR